MVDEAFAESIVHAPPSRLARLRGLSAHVVLGRRLRPLCFWHRFALDAIASPFVGGRGPLDLAALDTATRVCQSARPVLLRASLFPRLSAYALQYRYGRIDRFTRELAKFVEYRTEFEQGPVYAETDESEPIQSPWYQVVVFQLLQFDPYLRKLAETYPARAEQKAWMMPVGQGLWRLASLAEARGEKIEILTEDQRVALRAAGYEEF